MTSKKESAKGTGICRETVRGIKDYGKCKDKLYFRLVNTEKSQELLEKAPHMEIMDLSMICYVLIRHIKNGIASIPVTDSLVKNWGVPVREIMAQAVRNAPKILPIKVGNMLSILKEASPTGDIELYGEEDEKAGFFMMTNNLGIDGFGAVLYPGALKDFADGMGKDFYVLPSSRHEALLLPVDGYVAADDLRCLVRSVNETEVAEEDILSYHVYYYDRSKNELRVTGEDELCVRL